jgi:hypothetical protein
VGVENPTAPLADRIVFRTGYEVTYPMIWKHKHKDFVALTFTEHHDKPAEGLASWGASAAARWPRADHIPRLTMHAGTGQ